MCHAKQPYSEIFSARRNQHDRPTAINDPPRSENLPASTGRSFQDEEVIGCDFLAESAHPGTVDGGFVRSSYWSRASKVRAGVPRSNARKSEPKKDIGVVAITVTCRDLPYGHYAIITDFARDVVCSPSRKGAARRVSSKSTALHGK